MVCQRLVVVSGVVGVHLHDLHSGVRDQLEFLDSRLLDKKVSTYICLDPALWATHLDSTGSGMLLGLWSCSWVCGASTSVC